MRRHRAEGGLPEAGSIPEEARQLRRDLRAGDVRILLAALVLAVVAVTAVGFVTDRAERALALEANRLLGGDAELMAALVTTTTVAALVTLPAMLSVARALG